MSAVDKILALTGRTREGVARSSRTRIGKILRRNGVPDSPEVQRVRSLPRREPVPSEVVELLHETLLEPWSKDRLRDDQIAALVELVEMRTLFAHIPVGGGKTPITLAAPVVLDSKRPVLVVPASLRDKTKRDYAKLVDRGWRVVLPRIVSYSELSITTGEALLEQLDADLLIFDEAHKLRDLEASGVRKIERWLAAHPEVSLVLLSGTLIAPQLVRWHHLAEWTLGPERMPLPVTRDECVTWSQALDQEDPRGLGTRLELGALSWSGGWPGFAAHVLGSRGVVGSNGTPCPASLEIRPWHPGRPPAAVREAMRLVKEEGTRPDGELLSDAEIVECLQQLALGFYYIWDPPPPAGWREARSEWLAVVNRIKRERRPGLDSELQIKRWVLSPRHKWTANVLEAWEEAERTYKPPRKAVWITDDVLRLAVDHAQRYNALVWHRWRAVGERFEHLGLPHFGDNGLDCRGRFIEDHEGPASCSISANGTGRNLQRWNRSLVLSISPSAEKWEQLIGREHRPGQEADEVIVDAIASIQYHTDSLRRARDEAEHLSNTTQQKLTLATWA